MVRAAQRAPGCGAGPGPEQVVVDEMESGGARPLWAQPAGGDGGGGGLTTLGQALVGEELGRTTMALASTAGFLPGGVRHAKPSQR